jgi:hypothetical protein
MSFIYKLKRFLLYLLLRIRKSTQTVRQPVSLRDARNIGVLFNAQDIQVNDVILKFCQQLKAAHKEVQLLGYMPKREFGFVYPFPFITDKDTTWYGKPGGGTSGYFMRTPFDLMINFSTEELLPLEYITATSGAKFRVGFQPDADISNYDLILIPKENKDISNLIQNLETYLK